MCVCVLLLKFDSACLKSRNFYFTCLSLEWRTIFYIGTLLTVCMCVHACTQMCVHVCVCTGVWMWAVCCFGGVDGCLCSLMYVSVVVCYVCMFTALFFSSFLKIDLD